MVEPITVATLSGLSAISGAILSKFGFSRAKELPNPTQNNEFGVEFIALKEQVKARQLSNYLRKGKPIFINLKELNLEPEEFEQFIKELQALGDNMFMKINSVSPKLLLITPKDQKINILWFEISSLKSLFSSNLCSFEFSYLWSIM